MATSLKVAQGSEKVLVVARQPSKGVAADPTTGQVVRRESSTFEHSKETYTTETENTRRRQLMSSRHGSEVVNGSLTGILSAGTYADYLSAILMRDFSEIPSVGGVGVTIAGTGPTWTVTRGAGDWLADGAKIGRVIRLAGGLAAANAAKNLLILGVSATVLTVRPLNGVALAPEGPVAGVTASFPGAITYVPETGHTDVYYTVEELYSDVGYSETSTDVKFTSATLRLPGSGNAGIDLSAIGLEQTDDADAYFTDPAPETTTGALVAASGALVVGGVVQAVVTDLSITMDARGAAADPVVGSTIRPDVFTGKLMVTGSLTAYFINGVMPGLYKDEVATSIVSAFTSGSANNADFMSVTLSQVKLNSATPDDVETGLKRTYNFVAEFNSAGGAALATNATTVEIQDSAVTVV